MGGKKGGLIGERRGFKSLFEGLFVLIERLMGFPCGTLCRFQAAGCFFQRTLGLFKGVLFFFQGRDFFFKIVLLFLQTGLFFLGLGSWMGMGEGAADGAWFPFSRLPARRTISPETALMRASSSRARATSSWSRAVLVPAAFWERAVTSKRARPWSFSASFSRASA